MSRSQPVRVAILRCDIHAYFFAALMRRPDPRRLQQHCPLIHRLLTDPETPERYLTPPVPGFRITAAWDADEASAHRFAETFGATAVVCRKASDVTDHADAGLIACCSGDGSDHLALARPLLKAGIPTFVDKPFAATTRDAQAMIRLVTSHDTPLMSASMLHVAEAVAFQQQRRPEVGRLGLGIIHGSHGWENEGGLEGVSHGIAMALAVYGRDVEWVECMGELSREFILLRYADGGKVLVVNMDQTWWPGAFSTEAWGYRSSTGTRTHVNSSAIGDLELPAAGKKLIRQFRTMVRTGAPPMPYPTMLAWVRIAEAAEEAQRTGKRVEVGRRQEARR